MAISYHVPKKAPKLKSLRVATSGHFASAARLLVKCFQKSEGDAADGVVDTAASSSVASAMRRNERMILR
jgi:hypothetical protein